MNRMFVRLLAMAITAISSETILAETYTWTGASGGSWNEPSNWSVGGNAATTIPGGGDTAAISGIASIIVNSDAAIGGLTLTGSTGLTLSGAGKLALGQAETVFNAAATLDVKCELTGSGKLVKRGVGDLSLRADNTFTGGFLGDGTGGDIWVRARTAFGNGPVTINHNTINLRMDAAKLAVANDITFTGTDQEHSGSIIVNQSGLALTGTIDFSRAKYPRLVSNSHGPHIGNLCLAASTVTSSYNMKVISPGDWYFDGVITGLGVLACDNAFTFTFNTSGNAVHVDCYDKKPDKKILCNVANVFTDQSQIRFFANATGIQSLDLRGHDQVLDAFFSENNSASTYRAEITSTGGAAILTARGTANRAFSGKITGGAGIRWAPTGAYTLTLDAPNSDTTGTLIASNGTLAVTGTSNFKNLSGVEVYAGATLSFAAGAKLNTVLQTLVVQEGATLVVADGVDLTVDNYYTVDSDGNRTLQPADSTFDLGNGVRVMTAHKEIPTVEATWTAGGADTLTSTAANWNKAVDLTTGGVVATFAEAGVRATVDGAVKFKGLIFDAPGIDSGNNSFYIEPADADAQIKLFEEGLVVRTPTSGSRTYDILSPLAVMSDQLWDLPSPISKSAVFQRGRFFVQDSRRLEIRGGGKYNGRVTFEGADGEINGTLVVTGAHVVVKGEAWKNAGEHGKVDFWDRPYDSAKLTFNNAVIGAEMEFHQMTAVEDKYGMDMPLEFAERSTNVFNGKLTVTGPQYLRFQCPGNSRIVFSGGMDYLAYYPVFNGAGYFIVTNTPIKVHGWWQESDGNTVLAVPGNCISISGGTGFGTSLASNTGNGIRLTGTSTMTIACDDAFAGNSWIHIGGTAKFDLGGHDVHIGNIRDQSGKKNLGSQFTSTESAVLTVSQLVDEFCVAAFTGSAGLKKMGGKTLTMLAASTSTGTVEVVEGTLDFASGATWAGASSVTVSGGTLKLASSAVFSKAADVHLTGGVLDLAEGVSQVVGDLYLNDGVRPVAVGLWGAMDNASVPVSHRTPLITGAGVLQVRGRRPGSVIIFH